MNHSSIANKLQTFITAELLDGQSEGLTASTPLLEWGVIDSLGMVSLLAFIDSAFGVEVPDEEVLPTHFQSIAALSDLVSRHVQTGAA